MKSLVYLKKCFFHKNKKKIAIQFENKKITYEQLYFEILNLSDYFKKKKIKKVCILEGKNDDRYVCMYVCLFIGWIYIYSYKFKHTSLKN